MKTVLVTGATGALGQALVARLRKGGKKWPRKFAQRDKWKL